MLPTTTANVAAEFIAAVSVDSDTKVDSESVQQIAGTSSATTISSPPSSMLNTAADKLLAARGNKNNDWNPGSEAVESEMQVDRDSEYSLQTKDRPGSVVRNSGRTSAAVESQIKSLRQYPEQQQQQQQSAHEGRSRDRGYGNSDPMAVGNVGPRSPSAESGTVGPASVGADVLTTNDPHRRSLSSISLTNQAEYTFASPLRTEGQQSDNANRIEHQDRDRHHHHQYFSERPSAGGTPRRYSESPEYQQSPSSYSQQAEEEDIRMSESPRLNESDGIKTSLPHFYHRQPFEGYTSEYTQHSEFRGPSHLQEYSGAQHPRVDEHQCHDSRSSISAGSTEAESSKRDGVTMPAKSAVLYHAGYNSGRGAVWRFFKVVEARVSGNTDRAECLLCKKRMLGKSADMKKHIVISCPNRRNISDDMKPILEIVKTELDNPKKRAKRNSNTPIVMRADGTFGPEVSGSGSSAPPYPDPMHVSSRMQISGSQHSHARLPVHVRAAPYDYGSDPQRAAKVAKYSRGPMRGSGSYMESGGAGPGGSGVGPERSARYSPQQPGQSAMSMPVPISLPQSQYSRPQTIQPSLPPPRIRSPMQAGGYQHRHPSGAPMAPPHMQQHLPSSQPPSQMASRASPMPQSHTPSQMHSQAQSQLMQQQQQQKQQEQKQNQQLQHQHQHQHQRSQDAANNQPLQTGRTFSGSQPQPSNQQNPQHQAISTPAQHMSYPPHPHSQTPRQSVTGPISTATATVAVAAAAAAVAQHPQTLQYPQPLSPRPHAGTSTSQYNRLKAKLQQRIPAFGVWLSIPSPLTARMLAAQGFDWACIDMEHAPTNPALMAEMVAAVASSGTCTPIVRVPSQAPEWLNWALDSGAHGVIVPMVNTAEEMRRVEKICRYPPVGKRSMSAFYAPAMFNLRGSRAMAEYVERASKDILVIPQIETAEAVSNLSSIIKSGVTDAIFVGPYDLGASIRTSSDMQFQEALGHIEKTAQECDVPIGIYASSGNVAWNRLNDGYTLLVAASDVDCLSTSAAENLERARGEGRVYR
ncbi:hypothetical protein LPJ64_005064 [Coemansia asiatica]|uniref:HpcH/HpaI aldolase/citrate lyase domain-containing protein n=1 Tax=Coemansia asiatica TaxID=1052880 RepID=A0A9W7XIF5_9FUNG|nr:hypothetical protein LPJ64_005064 [Coemansia asiatica]